MHYLDVGWRWFAFYMSFVIRKLNVCGGSHGPLAVKYCIVLFRPPVRVFTANLKWHLAAETVPSDQQGSQLLTKKKVNNIKKKNKKKKVKITFQHCAVWGVSHGLFLTLFHPHVAQECIPEAQWIKMAWQRRQEGRGGGEKRKISTWRCQWFFPSCLLP